MLPKVSVIIPIFNSEMYIERCIRSLFEQTMDNIEYIFIDDCSPDKSVDKLTSLIEGYKSHLTMMNSTVIIKRLSRNSGLPFARKVGLELSRGEYIIHCDSDDWVESSLIKECYEVAINNNSDIVFYDFDRCDSKNHHHIHRDIPANKNELVGKIIAGTIMGSLCGMMSRKKLYDGIVFFPKYNIHEDLLLSLQLIITASESYYYIPKALYHYYFNPNSITNLSGKKEVIDKFKQAYENINDLISYLIFTNMFTMYTQEIIARKCRVLYTLSRYTKDKEIKRLWHNTYDKIFFHVVWNKYLSVSFKANYYFTFFGLSPFFRSIKELFINDRSISL